MRKSLIVGILFALFSGYSVFSQVLEPVKWTFGTEYKGGDVYILKFTANIEDKWHIYGMNIGDGGPIPTSFSIEKGEGFEMVGKVKEVSKAIEKYDASFGINVEMFDGKAVFEQQIRVKTPEAFQVKGSLEFMSCDNQRCLPPREVAFTFSIPKTEGLSKTTSVDTTSAIAQIPMDSATLSTNMNKPAQETGAEAAEVAASKESSTQPMENESLLGFILLAIAAGLGGVFTPCVYPMIPMTVSFFMRGEQKRSSGIINGVAFGLSIILIYTLLGAIIAITRSGATVTNYISTNWLPNSIFFLLFVVFAFWFFGMFEIVLPGTLANKFDQKADKGGIAGAFFMALTLIIVSFSCTGPFIGFILVEASKGIVLKPIIGMFFYSLAFALPFVIFAISPVLLKKMAKSGSWLNTVKVVVAFILLAFSLKFLSTIDTTLHLNILPREIYLSIWIVVFTLLGFYLLGKLKFPNDGDMPHIPVPRFILAVAVFSFVVYMIPGLFGANLGAISGFLPPPSKNAFAIGAASQQLPATSEELCGTPKYSDFLDLPYNLAGYFDYEEGMACAKEKNKPVFLDIKGHACSNCKKMEGEVWSDPRVQERLRKNFVIIALYTDDKYKLPENEWVKTTDGRVLKTMAAKNLEYEITKFNMNTQPLYAILDLQGNVLSTMEMNLNVDEYLKFLDDGKEKFYSK